MMRRALIASLVLVSANIMVVTEATGFGEAVAQSQSSGPATNRVICRREAVSGSRLSNRVCLTQAQWEQRDSAERERRVDLVERADRENIETAAGSEICLTCRRGIGELNPQ